MKSVLYWFCIALTAPLWLGYRLLSAVTGNTRSFYGFSQLMSLFPGTAGNYLRYGFYKPTLAHLGRDACICFGATLSHPGTEIGSGVYVGPFANLGWCSLGDDVLIGTAAHIVSGFHQHGSDDLEKPMREQPGVSLQVRIGDDCWIGNHAVVGNHVGRKSIVGAASLVYHEVPELSIVAGNPAKILRSRTV